MVDRDKVIKGLECCTKVGELQFCTDEGCPYSSVPDCIDVLMRDALNLLKAQQPRVMTLEEAKDALRRDPVIWFEESIQHGGRIVAGLRIYETDQFTMQTDEVLGVNEFDDEVVCKYYGKKYRLWTYRPTDEQREAVKWV